VLGLILVFVGLKMAWLNEAFDGKLTITWSLGIILSILAIAIAASLLSGLWVLQERERFAQKPLPTDSAPNFSAPS
jgi:hypothetical protein